MALPLCGNESVVALRSQMYGADGMSGHKYTLFKVAASFYVRPARSNPGYLPTTRKGTRSRGAISMWKISRRDARSKTKPQITIHPYVGHTERVPAAIFLGLQSKSASPYHRIFDEMVPVWGMCRTAGLCGDGATSPSAVQVYAVCCRDQFEQHK